MTVLSDQIRLGYETGNLLTAGFSGTSKTSTGVLYTEKGLCSGRVESFAQTRRFTRLCRLKMPCETIQYTQASPIWLPL